MPKSKKETKALDKPKKAIAKKGEVDLSSIAKLLLKGDLSGLSEQEKLQYYAQLCKSFKLNPLTKPFDYIVFNRGNTRVELLYANKNAAEQLRINHGISIVESTTKLDGELCIVTVKVRDKNGREDTGIGAVNINGLKGTALADAIMKAETKAKRRATLSIAGLGMLDETELDFVYNGNKELPASPQVDRSDIMRRQVLVEKFKKISPDIRKRLHDLGYTIDDAMEHCESKGWDEEAISREMEVANVKADEDIF